MGDVQAHTPPLAGQKGTPGFLAQSSTPDPSRISAGNWRLAERFAERLIRWIQPTRAADERRDQVVEYVRGLIKAVADAEIFPFGSVPLKTYLPDGDIDLTAIVAPGTEEYVARDVLTILQKKEQDSNSEFKVKDVQYIHAEVKLVKCLVQNIVVDISFQQSGGLSSLCFLEKVDCMIGKNHLFKRSIILIKAWCYYESRILGAHHGLISTYALETLVLYILQVFHTFLDGPLAVLYRFLEYFSRFDWANYCITLNGPVYLSSLPEMLTESPKVDGGELLLSRDFLKRCEDEFSSCLNQTNSSSSTRSFQQKHLNIVDPLKANNNLGRSVSKGNCYRIRSAFAYGARMLGKILMLPREKISDELNKFFMNILDRHGSGERPDVQDTYSSILYGSFSSSSGVKVSLSKNSSKKDTGNGNSITSMYPSLDLHGGLFEGINDLKSSTLVAEPDRQSEPGKQPLRRKLPRTNSQRYSSMQSDVSIEMNSISGTRQIKDVKDTGGGVDPGKSSACKSLPTKSEVRTSPRRVYYAPHLFFCKENASVRCSEPETAQLAFEVSSRKMTSENREGISNLEHREKDTAITSSKREPSSLSDLVGDYDFHMKNLLCAMEFLDRQSSSSSYNKHVDALHQLNVFPGINSSVMSTGPFSPAPSYYTPSADFIQRAYGLEDLPRTRGTGTYIPNVNHWTYRERGSPGRGRNDAPANQIPLTQNNGQAVTQTEKILGDNESHGSSSSVQLPNSGGNGHWRPGQLESYLAARSTSRGFIFSDGLTSTLESGPEFVSFMPVNGKPPSPKPTRNLDPCDHQRSSRAMPASETHGLIISSIEERSVQTYHLKNDDDFPPLRGLVQSNT